jgi:hypothetical protein
VIICLNEDYVLERTAYPLAYIPPPGSHQILPCTATHTPTGWITALIATYSSPEQQRPTVTAQQRSREVQQYFDSLSVILTANAVLPRPLPCTLLGDFNAYVGICQESPYALPDSNGLHHPTHRHGDPHPYHQPTTTPSNMPSGRGRHLLNLCNNDGLIILNGRYSRTPTPPYTCQRTLHPVSTNTIIDYVILTHAHIHMVLTCTVLIEPLLTFSDHNPILLRLQSAPVTHTTTGPAPRVPIRTLYNEHKLSNPTLAGKLRSLWARDLPELLADFTRLDHEYVTKQILEQDYVDCLLTIVDNELAKTCSTCLGLRKPRHRVPSHPFYIPNPPMTPAHASARSQLLIYVRSASRLCQTTSPTDPSRAHHLKDLSHFHDQLRATDAKHAILALLKRIPTYDASITPSTPAFSIRRVKHAPLPTQLHTNSSLDKAVYILGNLTTEPHLLAAFWNECRSSMGHTLIGHPSSPWNEAYTSRILQTFSTILDDIRGPAHLRVPPCPYNTQDSPFTIPRLTKMIQLLPGGKSPGPSGITYTIVKKCGLPLITVLHHLFTRLWNLAAPHTHNNAVAVSPTQWALNLLKPVHKPPKPKPDPHNYRGIGLGVALGMIYQLGLQYELLNHTSNNDLLTSAQGACQTNRQPFDTVYIITEFIASRAQIHHQPTFVFFGDIALAFPAVNREILLVRLHAAGVPPKIWQHILALHRTLKYRILHGYSEDNPYIEIFKGLTEGGRLSPLLWGLYIADLVTTIRRQFPDTALPHPHAFALLAILLYVDDFCLIASSVIQLLEMMHTTQTWCEDNRLTISTKSKVMVFHESRQARALRGETDWSIRRDFPHLTTPLPIAEVSQFVYIGVTVDPTLTYDHHCAKVIRTIQMSTNHLIFAREATPALRTHTVMILYRLWASTVAVHALSNLVPLRAPAHLDLLQVALNASLSRLFGIPKVSIRLLHIELGFPPLLHQCDIALARFNCHLALAPPDSLHSIMYHSRRLQGSDLTPNSLEQCTRSALIRLGRPHDYDHFTLPVTVASTRTTRPVRTYARSLYVITSNNWRTALLSIPAARRRHHSYTNLFDRDLRRPNLFLPSPWLRQHPVTPGTITLLQLRTQDSYLPTHRHHVLPSAGVSAIPYRPFPQRTCPYCPHIPGDEIHMFLRCPRFVPRTNPAFDSFTDLLTTYDLTTHPFSTIDYLSLLLATDPSPWIQGTDRLEWMTRIVPISIQLASTVSTPLPL